MGTLPEDTRKAILALLERDANPPPPSSPVTAPPYVQVLLGIMGFATAGAVSIVVFHPGDNSTILTMIFVLAGTLSTGVLALMRGQAVNAEKTQETHLAVNSRMDQLIAVVQKSSKAEGVLEGKSDATNGS